ncbi:alcohol dehydrogenase catalytic domain-containing protein [Streptosporangium sp. NPDC023963]|uniref:alcohol dehydrogenase catalytic domain-containing protein n=1 Tax=Streptosporangium sp. NPDC023963 TaxID=3155608 RepID=UPI00343A8DE6
MLAARLHIPSREVRMEKVPVPEPGPGQVRVEVRAAGVCLSDVHLADGTLPPKLLKGDVVTLGHEVAGVVDVLGAGVTDRAAVTAAAATRPGEAAAVWGVVRLPRARST